MNFFKVYKKVKVLDELAFLLFVIFTEILIIEKVVNKCLKAKDVFSMRNFFFFPFFSLGQGFSV